jgi:hypothetical protein
MTVLAQCESPRAIAVLDVFAASDVMTVPVPCGSLRAAS